MIKGILTSAQPVIQTGRDKKMKLGYYVRLHVAIRGKENFLLAIQRTLFQYQVKCDINLRESKSSPRPVLTIKGLGNITTLCDQFIVDNGKVLIDSQGKWHKFVKVLDIMNDERHLIQTGFDEILETQKRG